jgi:hypothetical protein
MINRIKSLINKLNLFGWFCVFIFYAIVIFFFFIQFEFTNNCSGGTLYGCAVDIFVWIIAFGVLTFLAAIIFGLFLAIFNWIKTKF